MVFSEVVVLFKRNLVPVPYLEVRLSSLRGTSLFNGKPFSSGHQGLLTMCLTAAPGPFSLWRPRLHSNPILASQ
jgi:hypothetical protein